MSNHTPGKWLQSHREIPNDKKGDYATQVYTEDGENIATLSWYAMPKVTEIIDGEPRGVIKTYREANAKLIAAAPELLEACQEFLKVINRTPTALEHYGSAIMLAESAIAKAVKP